MLLQEQYLNFMLQSALTIKTILHAYIHVTYSSVSINDHVYTDKREYRKAPSFSRNGILVMLSYILCCTKFNQTQSLSSADVTSRMYL